MGMSRQRGFTLIELMVALAIAAILLTIAIPSFQSFVNSNRLTSSANELIGSLQLARMDALQFNKRAVVCTSANPNAASPTCSTSNPTGWITFLDKSSPHNTTYESGTDTLLRVSNASGQVQIRWNANVGGKVVFRSDGMARTAAGGLLMGTVDMCMPTDKPEQNVRRITIGDGSRISIDSQNTGADCTAYSVPDPI